MELNTLLVSVLLSILFLNVLALSKWFFGVMKRYNLVPYGVLQMSEKDIEEVKALTGESKEYLNRSCQGVSRNRDAEEKRLKKMNGNTEEELRICMLKQEALGELPPPN